MLSLANVEAKGQIWRAQERRADRSKNGWAPGRRKGQHRGHRQADRERHWHSRGHLGICIWLKMQSWLTPRDCMVKFFVPLSLQVPRSWEWGRPGRCLHLRLRPIIWYKQRLACSSKASTSDFFTWKALFARLHLSPLWEISVVNPKTAAAPRLHPEGFRVQSMLLCACGTGQTSEDAGLRPQFYGLSRREALQVEGLQANSATLTILLCTTSFFPGGSVRFFKKHYFPKI